MIIKYDNKMINFNENTKMINYKFNFNYLYNE